MKKISKKQIEKMEKQMNICTDRGNTWTGIRPVVFRSAKNDKKIRRAESKRLCAAY